MPQIALGKPNFYSVDFLLFMFVCMVSSHFYDARNKEQLIHIINLHFFCSFSMLLKTKILIGKIKKRSGCRPAFVTCD